MVNTTKEGLTLVLIIFAAYVMEAMLPAQIPLSMADIFSFVVIGGLVLTWGMLSYFRWESPTVLTETTRINSMSNRVISVRPDDARLPNFLAIPFGGTKAPVVRLGSEDFGTKGGAIFAPTYLVEMLGTHIVIHGRPIPVTKEVVEQNAWMLDALEAEEGFQLGLSQVWVVIAGEGPPVDIPMDSRETYKPEELRKAQANINQKLRSLEDVARTEIAQRQRFIIEARRPSVQDILVAEREKKAEVEKKAQEDEKT